MIEVCRRISIGGNSELFGFCVVLCPRDFAFLDFIVQCFLVVEGCGSVYLCHISIATQTSLLQQTF